MARWAQDHGLEQMYLQVEEGNEPARALCASAGFTMAYGYHYRARPRLALRPRQRRMR